MGIKTIITGMTGVVIKTMTVEEDFEDDIPIHLGHNKYRISLETNKGLILIVGDHDFGPAVFKNRGQGFFEVTEA